MFYQVRIYDRDGNLKRIISTEDLKQIHWKKFDPNKKQFLAPQKGAFDSLGFQERSKSEFKLKGSW